MKNETRSLARFASGLGFDSLDQDLVVRFKIGLLDAVGCAMHGSAQPWARMVNRFIKEQRGKREATLWLQRFRGPSANVALGLGVMIHSFDFDDYHNAKIHPGAPVIPAAMAVGESIGASGKAVIAAMVSGYETMIRISLATGPNASRSRGWHLTGTTGTFGAAAAAGNLLGLDEERMASALGMAGTQSAGLWAFTADGAMSKRFHPGRAAQSGVMAALLARMGFRGPTQILEATDGGFCKATSDQTDLSLITEGLGSRFLCRDVNIKPYACCASAHSAIDAVLELRKRHRFSPSDVERIRVKTAEGVKLQCGFEYRALGTVQAQMSLQYIVAVSLLDGQAMPEQFADARIAEPQVLALAGHVEIVADPEMNRLYPEHYANKVEILLKSGQRLEARVDDARGSVESPIGFPEITEKFRSLAAPVIGTDRTDAFIDTVEGLELLDDVGELTRMLA